MSVRLLLTEEAGAEIAPILATIKSRAGSPPALRDRMFLEAVLYLARTGTPWRDLPADCGHWDAVSNRLRRWEARGLWRQLWERLRAEDCRGALYLFIDATIVRAHQHAAGALKKTVVTQHRLSDALGGAYPPKSMPAVSMSTPGWLLCSRKGTVMRAPSSMECVPKCLRSSS